VANYPQPTATQLRQIQSRIDDGGLDFGVVTVWSCPDSCAGSSSEVAIVQAPADF
jgi:hypothetical protein